MEEEFAMRVGSIDYYLDTPADELDVSRSVFMGTDKLQRVPILRIFGATKDGKKACLHLHRCFPYMYIPFCDDWPQRQCPELDEIIHQFANSVEKAMRIHGEAQRAAAGQGAGGANSNRQYVLKAQVVRAVPYYGCFLKEKLYVKLVLIDPATINSAAALLAAGSIMDSTFQPHNSHLPFILQCMTDLNLVGMGHIRRELFSLIFLIFLMYACECGSQMNHVSVLVCVRVVRDYCVR